MRIIFMGTPDFAVPSLEILVEHGYNVVAVVTAADSLGGRGGKMLLESAVKKCAVRLGIPVLQPARLKSPEFIEALRHYAADLQIVVAFRMLPEVVWNMPPLGTFNLHGSLLPKYRGAAPIQHAIMEGETVTGVTSFRLQHTIDTGDILIQRELPIYETDTAGDVHDRMMAVGAQVVLETVQFVSSGSAKFIPQNNTLATSAPKIFHSTCHIDWTLPVKRVYDFIRALSPYPGAWCWVDGKEMKIIRLTHQVETDDVLPGRIVTDGRKQLSIKCADGYIHILELKAEGKKQMSTVDFLNGYTLTSDTVE